MSDLDDREALAAEYVLGTLTREERTDVARRRLSDAELDAAIVAWEHRLGPMITTVKPVEPDAQLFERIRERVGMATNVVSFKTREAALRKSTSNWRSAAIGLGALAAALAGVIGWREAAQPTMPTTYVAVLQADKTSPAFLMTVDTKTQMFAVRAVTGLAERGKSYELWLVNAKLDKPMSLGLLEGEQTGLRPMERPGVDKALYMDATYAVSLEPQGGSPTGTPTGPVLFSGKLYKSTP